MAVGSRNLQETVRKYCPWLVKASGITFFQGSEDVNIETPANKDIICLEDCEMLILGYSDLQEATDTGHCSVINFRLPDFWVPNVTNGLIKPLFGNAARGKSMTWMVLTRCQGTK